MIYTLGLKKAPFHEDSHQIIYIEGQYDDEVNRYIQQNYANIRQHFSACGYDFIYLPKLANELKADGSLNYFAPYLTDGQFELKSDLMLRWMVYPQKRDDIPPSLIYHAPYTEVTDYPMADLFFKAIPLKDYAYDLTDDLSIILKAIANDIIDDKEEEIRFRIGDEEEAQNKNIRKELEERRRKADMRCADRERKPKRNWFSDVFGKLSQELFVDDNVEDDTVEERWQRTAAEAVAEPTQFDEETLRLMAEVTERLNALYDRGISSYVLRQLLETQPKLSRLHITKDGRIFLPDYNNKEIQMTPIHKAVYFLFLGHPEGIEFKMLQDYRDELITLYKKVKPTYTRDSVKSIDDLVNPFSNAINEKVSRIRATFLHEFDERYAQHYYIQGERAEAKKIILPRELVEWEE